MLSSYATHAPQLQQLGYDPTPCKGKAAFLSRWTERPAHDPKDYPNCNIGVLTGGKHQLIALDVDVTVEVKALQIDHAIRETFGDAPKRIGQAPKFLYVFRCDELLQKQKVQVDGGAVEVLGEGQQFVASGVHPDTKKRYEWPGDSIRDFRADELPLIKSADLATFLKTVELAPSVTKAPAKLNEITDGNWHDPVRDYIARLVAKGIGRDEGVTLCTKAFRQPGYSPEQTEREVAELWDGAVAKGFAPEPRSKRRPFQTISEVFYAEPIEWLVEGLIPKRGVGLISGASGSFKSFLSGYLALCVTNGADFAGRCITQPGRALFAAHEGRQGMAGRLLAACKHYGFQESKFSLWDGVTLANESDIEFLANDSQRFDLTVIDTLSKATPGIDENSNSEMAAALDRAYKLADLWKGFVLIVSHSGKDETKGPRGASALKANVDTVMLVKRSAKAMFVNLSLDKQKDGPDELRFDFKMEEVSITNEATGEITTELVPVAVGNKASALKLIKIVLNENGEMTDPELQLGVTTACIANRDKPVTKTAFSTALSRGKQRGEIVETNGKLRLVGALTL